MIHETHEGEEQGKDICAYHGGRDNSIQLEIEQRQLGNVGKEVGRAEEEAGEERDHCGVENVTCHERRVAAIRLVRRQHGVGRRWAAVIAFTGHYLKN